MALTSFLPTNQHSFGAPSASSGARHYFDAKTPCCVPNALAFVCDVPTASLLRASVLLGSTHCSAVACPDDDDDGGLVVYILYFSGTRFTFTGERASEVGAVELSVKEVCSLQRVGSLSYSISYGHVRRITESTVEDGHLYPCTWAGVASGCITLFACCQHYILASICSVGWHNLLPSAQPTLLRCPLS